MEIKIHSQGAKFEGSVYLVVRHHYMGMDGDYTDIVAGYSTLRAAQVRMKREEERDVHEQGSYDMVWYYIEEVSLVC
jgi:hypothetical protein